MKTISITAYNRPEYLRQTLAGLAAAGCKDWHLFASVEPSDKIEEIKKIFNEATGFASKNITLNTKQKGHRKNQHDALAMAFDAGSTFNLHLDDDLFISPDALALASFYKERFSAKPLTCGSYGLFNYNSNAVDAQSIIVRKGTFTGLGWCVFRENWQEIFSPLWFDDSYAKKVFSVITHGWDWNIHGYFRTHGIYECFPALSRTNHAGREGGTCCSEAFYDTTFPQITISNKNEETFIVEERNE